MALDQSIQNESRHAVFIQRFAGGLSNDFAPYLEQLQKEISFRLISENQTLFNQRRLNVMLKEIRDIQLGIYADYDAELFKQLELFSDHEIDFELSSLEDVTVSGAIDFTKPSPVQVWAAARSNPLVFPDSNDVVTLEPFVKNWSTQEIKRVNNIIQTGFITGETNAQIAQRISGKGGTLDKVTRRNNRVIVRTATNHVSAIARERTMKENDDIVIGYEWVSTLDFRTSSTCFTGNTEVSPVCDIDKLYRSDYTGEIITLNLSTGKKIEGTPNHPVLTQEGWTNLGKIDPSYHIIYTVTLDAFEVGTGEDVYIPTTFSELYDSVRKISAFDISSKSASAADFNGDGVGMNGEVNIINTKGHLRCNFKTSVTKKIKNALFGLIKHPISFISYCCAFKLALTRAPSIKTSEFTASSVERGEKTGSRYTDLSFYFGRTKTIIKHLNSIVFGKLCFSINVTSRPALHETDLLKEARNCRGSGFVMPTDTCGRLPIVVSSGNIIGKSSEFKSCHVYTLSTSQGYYTAGGMIVKNCKSLDGRVFKWKDKYKPQPPIHPNCRSTTAPVLDQRFNLDDGTETRASKGDSGGKQIKADTTYYSFLKSQSAAFQNETLGPTRGKLFRNGGLTPDEFARLNVDQKFRPLSLEAMRDKNPMAFEKANL